VAVGGARRRRSSVSVRQIVGLGDAALSSRQVVPAATVID